MLIIYIHKIFFLLTKYISFYVKYLQKCFNDIISIYTVGTKLRYSQIQTTHKKKTITFTLSQTIQRKNVNNFLSHKYKVYVVLQIALHNLLQSPKHDRLQAGLRGRRGGVPNIVSIWHQYQNTTAEVFRMITYFRKFRTVRDFAQSY